MAPRPTATDRRVRRLRRRPRADPPPESPTRVVDSVLSRPVRPPLHRLVSDRLLLPATGRRSGRGYRFPVGYERDGDRLSVTSHGTNGWKNLRDCDQTSRSCSAGSVASATPRRARTDIVGEP
ncbi:hypothetical protein BRD13_01910 [Halobacteriales archaeon SW_5_70_135]|nr:MAG: hypothetical protein BRD13_01910 [Halobacteriales archaeon SW_5_70_135]